jgi:hypothetical protein
VKIFMVPRGPVLLGISLAAFSDLVESPGRTASWTGILAPRESGRFPTALKLP